VNGERSGLDRIAFKEFLDHRLHTLSTCVDEANDGGQLLVTGAKCIAGDMLRGEEHDRERAAQIVGDQRDVLLAEYLQAPEFRYIAAGDDRPNNVPAGIEEGVAAEQHAAGWRCRRLVGDQFDIGELITAERPEGRPVLRWERRTI